MMNHLKNHFSHTKSAYSHYLAKKGMKMSQLHFYTGANSSTPSGIKVCIFGATSSIGTTMASLFTPKGSPTVMVHRNALDIFAPTGDDVLFQKSNPYRTYSSSYLQFDLCNDVR